LRKNAAALHDGLKEAAGKTSKLELSSDRCSFVQQLRWTGTSLNSKEQIADAETELLAMAKLCREQFGVRLQVCVPGSCNAECAFGERVGAPAFVTPTIRLCASASQSPEDIAAVCKAVGAMLAAN